MSASNVVTNVLFTVLLVIIIVLYNSILVAANDEEVYVPYPIIFVHGIASSESRWDVTKKGPNGLNEYFVDTIGGDKYEYAFNGELSYFPHCDYRKDNNGGFNEIAIGYLGPSIDYALKSFPNDYKGDKKVIIICHSMGGLVARSLETYSDKINKVIFIGTPHLGSCYASMIWILNELRTQIMPTLIMQNLNFASRIIGSRMTSPVAILFPQLLYKLEGRLNNMKIFLLPLDLGGSLGVMPDPKGTAIEQLCLAGNVDYYDLVEGYVGYNKKSVLVQIGHKEKDTYLKKNNNSLYTPKTYRNLIGMCTLDNWKVLPLQRFEPRFSFPLFKGNIQSLSNTNTYGGGDGIVSKESQKGIGISHYGLQENHLTEGTTQQGIETILKAIDDAPEVTSIYAVPKNWKAKNREEAEEYYIIVRCKEYLLADVEVTTLTLDGESLLDKVGSGGKPYNKFGKDFLREREAAEIRDKDDKAIKLKPGEFYILAKIPNGENNNKHTIEVQLINPAKKVSEKVKGVFSRPYLKSVDFQSQGKDTTFPHHWTIDVPVFDEAMFPGAKDYIGNDGDLSFVIDSPLFKDVNVDIRIYLRNETSAGILLGDGLGGELETLVDNKQVSLNGGGDTYSSAFPDNSQINKSELNWDGKDKLANPVAEGKNYTVRIFVRSQDETGMSQPFDTNDSTGRQGLLGCNWDNYSYPYGDMIFTDPAYVQYSRQSEIPLGLSLDIELAGLELPVDLRKDTINNIGVDYYKPFVNGVLLPVIKELVFREQEYLAKRREIIGKVDRDLILMGEAEESLCEVTADYNSCMDMLKKKLKYITDNINSHLPQGDFIRANLDLTYRGSCSTPPLKIKLSREL